MPRLNCTDLAAVAGVHKSTVSRQARAAGLVGRDGLIDQDAYLALRADGLDPALQTTGRAAPAEDDGGLMARERARKMAADAQLAELTLEQRRGDLIPRARVAAVLGPAARRLRDRLCQVARDAVRDDADRAACDAAIHGAIETFSEEMMADGGGAAA
jgi:hypothetical protein